VSTPPLTRRRRLDLCEPLQEWRPDVPGLWPHCANPSCGRDIRTGDRYLIVPNTLTILCVPCTGMGARP
jgi:hypothetical protein